ncbi:MAG: hypothetical protein GY859_06280, partial [Desulfobacterales bacterium]|nr:hypothetical protein [Desulfobacterales bacterium]
MDQTWVSHGSRRVMNPSGEKLIDGSGDPRGVSNARLDDFDILDDEINQWLGPILAKADCLVFVSDSCHSGTITRGESTGGRAAPMDSRPHPAGKREYDDAWHDSGVRIGAAGDNENAAEFIAGDGGVYGFFTWHWARALRRARPGETWEDVFKRASARIALSKGCSQHPRIEGKEIRDRPIFGGSFEKTSKTVVVKRVRGQGKRVVLGVGALLGGAVGSIYRYHDPAATHPGALPAAEIIRVYPFESVARVIRGRLRAGDLLVEESHVYTIDPIKVFVNADFPETVDKPLLAFIEEVLADMDGFETSGEQARADLVLYVSRPRMKNGRFIERPEINAMKHSLPESFRREPPWVWVLTPEEKPLYENLRIDLAVPVEGGRLLRENLERIARVRALKGLESPPGGERPVDLAVTVLRPAECRGRA